MICRIKQPEDKIMARGISLDDRIYGDEPVITKNSKDIDLIHAYNWYNYRYDAEDAKKFILNHLKSKKIDRETLKKVSLIDSEKLRNIGWNFRIIHRGGSLPPHIHKKVSSSLNDLIDCVVEPQEEVKSIKKVDNTNTLIGDLEEQVDKFLVSFKTDFDPSVWIKNVKTTKVSSIKKYYSELYDELFEAYQGSDKDLKEAYSYLSRPKLKKYIDFIKAIIAACDNQSTVVRAPRKPRKKKVKSATVLVSKLNYKKTDEEYKLTSVNATDIIGASQLWTFNTKTRALTQYNAIGASGLTVKGSSIVGFDEKTSITKKLRKPEQILKNVQSFGKVALRKIMDELTTKPVASSGRINTEVILLRIIK